MELPLTFESQARLLSNLIHPIAHLAGLRDFKDERRNRPSRRSRVVEAAAWSGSAGDAEILLVRRRWVVPTAGGHNALVNLVRPPCALLVLVDWRAGL